MGALPSVLFAANVLSAHVVIHAVSISVAVNGAMSVTSVLCIIFTLVVRASAAASFNRQLPTSAHNVLLVAAESVRCVRAVNPEGVIVAGFLEAIRRYVEPAADAPPAPNAAVVYATHAMHLQINGRVSVYCVGAWEESTPQGAYVQVIIRRRACADRVWRAGNAPCTCVVAQFLPFSVFVESRYRIPRHTLG